MCCSGSPVETLSLLDRLKKLLSFDLRELDAFRALLLRLSSLVDDRGNGSLDSVGGTALPELLLRKDFRMLLGPTSGLLFLDRKNSEGCDLSRRGPIGELSGR